MSHSCESMQLTFGGQIVRCDFQFNCFAKILMIFSGMMRLILNIALRWDWPTFPATYSAEPFAVHCTVAVDSGKCS